MLNEDRPRLPAPLRKPLIAVMQQVFGQVQALDSRFAGTLTDLEGKTVAIHLPRLQLWLFFHGNNGRLQVDLDPPPGVEQADAVLQGDSAALLGMALPDWPADEAGPVRIEGDARAARALEAALKQLQPDWEQALTDRLGDVLGHQLWRLLRAAGRQARGSGEKLLRDGSDWLIHDGGLLPHRLELEDFYREVDQLREAADRLEARLKRLLPPVETDEGAAS